MISSIAPATKVSSITPAETKKAVVTDEVSEKKAKKTLEFTGFTPSSAKALANKFETKEVGGSTLLATNAVRDGEEKLLKELFGIIDHEHHGAVWEGKDDGTINLDNIKKMREYLRANSGETLKLKEASGRNLTTATINRMLTYLEKTAREFGDNGELTRAQMQNAFDKTPQNELLYTP